MSKEIEKKMIKNFVDITSHSFLESKEVYYKFYIWSFLHTDKTGLLIDVENKYCSHYYLSTHLWKICRFIGLS